jgi:hypothetical protein
MHPVCPTSIESCELNYHQKMGKNNVLYKQLLLQGVRRLKPKVRKIKRRGLRIPIISHKTSAPMSSSYCCRDQIRGLNLELCKNNLY